MNTFFYNHKPNNAFTTEQMKHIHRCLTNLGLQETYDQFLMKLSDYCEQQMAEGDDFRLTDKEAAPFVSNYVLTLLEQMTQSNLLSKIFALSSPQRQATVDLQVPVIFVNEEEILEYIRERFPAFEPYLEIPENEQGFMVGFSRPQPQGMADSENTTQQETFLPRPESVSCIKVGTASIPQKEPDGTTWDPVVEIVKLSLFVGEYEFPLFRNTDCANTVVVETIPCQGTVMVQGSGFLTTQEYLSATKTIAKEPQRLVSPLTASSERR